MLAAIRIIVLLGKIPFIGDFLKKVPVLGWAVMAAQFILQFLSGDLSFLDYVFANPEFSTLLLTTGLGLGIKYVYNPIVARLGIKPIKRDQMSEADTLAWSEAFTKSIQAGRDPETANELAIDAVEHARLTNVLYHAGKGRHYIDTAKIAREILLSRKKTAPAQ